MQMAMRGLGFATLSLGGAEIIKGAGWDGISND